MAELLCVVVSVLRGYLTMDLEVQASNMERLHCLGLNGGVLSRSCSHADPPPVHVCGAGVPWSIKIGRCCIQFRRESRQEP